MSKAQLFKKLLKETIREVIREELPQIIREELRPKKQLVRESIEVPRQQQIKPNGKVKNPYAEFLPKVNIPKSEPVFQQKLKANPLADLIADAGRNIQAEEWQSITADPIDSSAAQMFGKMPLVQQNPVDMNLGEIEEWVPQNIKGFPGN